MPQDWRNAEATLRHDLNNILDKAIQITNPQDLLEFCCFTGTFTTLNILCLCLDYTRSWQTCAPHLILLTRLSGLQPLIKQAKENGGKWWEDFADTEREEVQEALALWGHSRKIQSLISRLPAKIQLPSQPVLGLNFNFCSLLRGKIGKRPSSKCVWGKDFQTAGLPPPHLSHVDPNQAATVRLLSPLQQSFIWHKPF